MYMSIRVLSPAFAVTCFTLLFQGIYLLVTGDEAWLGLITRWVGSVGFMRGVGLPWVTGGMELA